jgi:type VI secretion system protein ImpG
MPRRTKISSQQQEPMDTLLPYYERERAALRRLCREFAAKHPKLASELMLTAEEAGDPHVERLIQATALLNARIAKALDDDYARFTEALLNSLYPHYLRPLPPYSIASVDTTVAQESDAGKVATLPRGTVLKTCAEGSVCQFTTVYDVLLAPVAITRASFHPMVEAPASVRLPREASARITIEIARTSSKAPLDQLGLHALRIYLDGEPSFCARLRDALFMKTVCAYLESEKGKAWVPLAGVPLAPVGFAADEAMLPARPSEQPAYRLMTEFFSYREKFNFIDLRMADILARSVPACATLRLHLILADVRSDSDTARALAPLSAETFQLGCTPVINLFKAAATPIRLTQEKNEYPLLVDQKPASNFELYSVDSVRLMRKTASETSVTDFVPYYSLRHASAARKPSANYYLVHRDEQMASASAGYEYSISFVDSDFSPLAAQTGTVSLDVTLSNRDLPSTLPYRLASGDLQIEGKLGKFPVRFLRKPSASFRLLNVRGSHWRLISHLALNHRVLGKEGPAELVAMLKLHAAPENAVAMRQIDGIVALDLRQTNGWIRDSSGSAYLSGVEIRVTLEEAAYVGSGVHAFAQLLDHVFGLSVHLNSFTQLVILSSTTGKELLRCTPRNGYINLA